MCHRVVVMMTFACGDQEPVSDTKSDCGQSNCRYSTAHPQNCPNCRCRSWCVLESLYRTY
ncbi:hypothetical protein DENSPDRAFT_781827 [Dentipellis sp. KUC8613]|nr:hypothetical protein DENSPDRAFT_781827 [Dentipellis sp. KUC8613]